MKTTRPVIRRHVPSQGMSVSLADIMIAYIVVFDRQMPSDLPFATAGEQIRQARPDDWQTLMRVCQDTRSTHKALPYEQLAALIKAA